MSEQTNQTHDYRFVAGLALGSVVGVGLAMLLAPRAAAEIKERAAGSAKQLGDAVSGRYRDAKVRVSGTVEEIARKGDAVRDGVLDSVVSGALKVERAAQGLRRVPTDAQVVKAV